MGIFNFNRKKLKKSTDALGLTHLMHAEVFDVLQNYLPEGWVQVSFFAGCTETSVSPKFFVLTSEYKWIDCFSLLDNTNLIYEVFRPVNKIILDTIKKLPEKHRFNTVELTVYADGRSDARYQYAYNPKCSSAVERFLLKKQQEWNNRFERKKEQ